MESLRDLSIEIEALWEQFGKNMRDCCSGNKAAGVRARKNSIALEKLFKEFRKLSVPRGE